MECQSCKILVELNDFQHYKSDWHIYNIRLKCSHKPSISLEDFNTYVKEPSNKNLIKSFSCSLCKKTFKSNDALKGHNKTKSHLKKIQSVELKEKTKFEENGLNNKMGKNFFAEENSCLMCTQIFEDCSDFCIHLSEVHGFVIPYIKCLKSLNNFIDHFRQKLVQGICIFCGKHFKTSAAGKPGVVKHMEIKGHFTLGEMRPEFIQLYGSFYEFDLETKMKIASILLKDEEIEAMKTDSNELLLENGNLIGNKAFKIYYKQPAIFHKNIKLEKAPLTEEKKSDKNKIDFNKIQKDNLNLNLKTNSLNRKAIKLLH